LHPPPPLPVAANTAAAHSSKVARERSQASQACYSRLEELGLYIPPVTEGRKPRAERANTGFLIKAWFEVADPANFTSTAAQGIIREALRQWRPGSGQTDNTFATTVLVAKLLGEPQDQHQLAL
jgi:hypothetical protein